MQTLKSVLLVAAGAIFAVGAFAQSDPKLTSTVVTELDPNEVTLSRNLGTSTEFIGRAAWRVFLKNGAANALNNALFTAEAFVVNAADDTVVTGAIALIDTAVGDGATDVIHVNGIGERCKLVSPSTTRLSCDFTDSQLAIGESTEFIIVVRAPTGGGRIKLHWTFGGDEGKGGANGCCTKVVDTYTTLIDAAAANSTVKTHVQSFMVQTVSGVAFTGISRGAATEPDPWATFADLGTHYLVKNDSARTYTKITVDEAETSTTLGSCSALNKNQCWLSNIAIPDTTWTPDDPLVIKLERHSSIIKNGSKLENYFIGYSKTSAIPFVRLQSCSLGGPVPGVPCVDLCEEISLGTKPPTFVWRCTINALDNGGYRPE